jgi:hypothetical protein
MAMPSTHHPASSTLCVDPAFESDKVPIGWHPTLLHTGWPSAGEHTSAPHTRTSAALQGHLFGHPYVDVRECCL